MTSPAVGSSSAAQWLQGLLATGASSQTGRPSNSAPSPSTVGPNDVTSISAQAFQLNQAAGVSSSGIKGAAHAGIAQLQKSVESNASLNPAGLSPSVSDRHRALDTRLVGSRLSLVC